MRASADIDAEIQTVEARLAALRMERVLGLVPADWPEQVTVAVRNAMGECGVDVQTGGGVIPLSDHVRIYFRIDAREEPDFAEDEGDEEGEE